MSITTIQYNDDIYDSPLVIAEAFSNFFRSDDIAGADYDLSLSRLPQSFFLFPTTSYEVFNLLWTLKRTSDALDGIHPIHVKMTEHAVPDILATIINIAFKPGIFPVERKRGKITPVFKKLSLR